jgi:hypothetical protein
MLFFWKKVSIPYRSLVWNNMDVKIQGRTVFWKSAAGMNHCDDLFDEDSACSVRSKLSSIITVDLGGLTLDG